MAFQSHVEREGEVWPLVLAVCLEPGKRPMEVEERGVSTGIVNGQMFIDDNLRRRKKYEACPLR
jgi:hypothetical protein